MPDGNRLFFYCLPLNFGSMVISRETSNSVSTVDIPKHPDLFSKRSCPPGDGKRGKRGQANFSKKLENLCIETLVRIDSLGRESALLIEPGADSKRKEEIEKIFKKALSSHWIVSAYMLKYIPESGEWLKKFRNVLEQEFGDSFGNAYNHALNEMELISSIGVKILKDYKKAITKKKAQELNQI